MKRWWWVPKAEEEGAPSKGSCPIASVTPRSITPAQLVKEAKAFLELKDHCACTITEMVLSLLAPSPPKSLPEVQIPYPHAQTPGSPFPTFSNHHQLALHCGTCLPALLQGLGLLSPSRENSRCRSLSSPPPAGFCFTIRGSVGLGPLRSHS